MKKTIKLLSMILAMILALSIFSVSANTDLIVNKTIADFMMADQIPGVAVLLYVDGKPYSYYYGYANLEKKYKVMPYSVFEIGSLTKLMTSLLLAQELDYANVSLNDPVKKYIKDLPTALADIKLLNLATHTSGLPFGLPASVNTKEELNEYLASLNPDYAPGEKWIYSNLGMGLLGDALEKSTSKDYDFLYRRHIVIPLRMHPIGLSVPPDAAKFYAQGYNRNGLPANQMPPGILAGAGRLKASAGDMQLFLSAAIGLPGTPERIFYPMRMTQTGYVRLSDSLQGLGWEIHPFAKSSSYTLMNASGTINFSPLAVKEIIERPTYTGDALIDKSGATDGFRAYIAVIPAKKSGIVILANKFMTNGDIVKAGRKILFSLLQM